MNDHVKNANPLITRWQMSLGVTLMFGLIALIGLFFSTFFAAFLLSTGSFFGVVLLFSTMPNQKPGNNGRIPAIVTLICSTLATGFCWMAYAENPSELSGEAGASNGSKIPANAQSFYSRVSSACPGFSLYSNSITFDRLDANDNVWYDGDTQSGLTAIYVKITGDISADPIARGNTCRYVLTKNEDRIISQKEACATLCMGYVIDLHGENFEARVP